MNLPQRIGHWLLLGITIMVAISTQALASQPASGKPPDPPDPPIDHLPDESGNPGMSRAASPPDRTSRHLGMASLGLMAGALGALWTRRRRVRHRRRQQYLYEAESTRLWLPSAPIDGPHSSPSRAPLRHRIRRFDYDRFYLHMTRDL